MKLEMATELEEKFRELSSAKTVRGVFILNNEGAAVKSSLDAKTTENFANVLHEVVATAKRLFNAQLADDLTFARFRTKKHEEIMVSCPESGSGNGSGFMLVVIHHPNLE